MLSDYRVHATLPTQDVDALRRFYEGVLGFEPHAIRSNAVAYRAGEGSLFVITRSGGSASGSHTQMGFTVADLATVVSDLRARGVVFEEYEMPKTIDGIADMPAGKAAWFKDPDGNLIGLAQFDEPF
jgi:catechol 2,3-dioxygenase-like lactoylglutathione lyase family enzyme